MLEAIIIIGQTLLLCVCIAAAFVLTVALSFWIEKQYKQRKARKERAKQRQRDRQRALKEREAALQFRLARTVWQLERENIELGNRKIYRQTIIINGEFATPSERAAVMRGAKKNEKNA